MKFWNSFVRMSSATGAFRMNMLLRLMITCRRLTKIGPKNTGIIMKSNIGMKLYSSPMFSITEQPLKGLRRLMMTMLQREIDQMIIRLTLWTSCIRIGSNQGLKSRFEGVSVWHNFFLGPIDLFHSPTSTTMELMDVRLGLVV